MPLGEGTRVEDKNSSGVSIDTTELAVDGKAVLFIDVSCRIPHLGGVFAMLVDDMLSVIDDGTLEPGPACAAALDRWRELLHATPGTAALRGAPLPGSSPS